MKKIVSIMLALAMIFSLALAAAEESMDERVDRIFRDTKAVGGAFLVAQNGEIVYEHYYGVQQKTTGVPVIMPSSLSASGVPSCPSLLTVAR